MTRRQKLIEKIQNNPAGVRFQEICRLAEQLGFTKRGGKGSHIVYERRRGRDPYVPGPKRDGQAVPSEATARRDRKIPVGRKRMKYAIVVAYSDDDKGYIATVPELPGCSAFGDTEEEAIKEVKVAASLWLAAAKKAKRPIPEPIVEKTFKARFPLRIPEDLRRRLELEAKRKGVSLNHLILQRIA
jgi:predicted RNase H-like HicB family nuclease/predicted RNA binding protein YcfA (HicA-like mRNA interferase family)